MRVFFLHRALEAILDQNECDFFAKKHMSNVLTREKTESVSTKSVLGSREAIFVTFRAFPNIGIVFQLYGVYQS